MQSGRACVTSVCEKGQCKLCVCVCVCPLCPPRLPQADLHSKLPDPKLNLAIQNHEYGMPPGFYERWPILKQWYNILTTSKDRDGIEYVSTMEAKKYPFTGESVSYRVVYVTTCTESWGRGKLPSGRAGLWLAMNRQEESDATRIALHWHFLYKIWSFISTDTTTLQGLSSKHTPITTTTHPLSHPLFLLTLQALSGTPRSRPVSLACLRCLTPWMPCV